jgi:hypothetical protein
MVYLYCFISVGSAVNETALRIYEFKFNDVPDSGQGWNRARKENPSKHFTRDTTIKHAQTGRWSR